MVLETWAFVARLEFQFCSSAQSLCGLGPGSCCLQALIFPSAEGENEATSGWCHCIQTKGKAQGHVGRVRWQMLETLSGTRTCSLVVLREDPEPGPEPLTSRPRTSDAPAAGPWRGASPHQTLEPP